MKPRKPSKTENTFSNNEKLQREREVRRDTDNIRNLGVTLYDIDYNIKWYIENVISPKLIENQSTIPIPVIFASPEKWSSIREHGYIRDSGDKIMSPLIAIRRSNVSPRTDINTSAVFRDIFIKDSSNSILYETKYTKENRYDQFSLLNGRPPLREFHALEVPQYVDVSYDLSIWTDRTDQMNLIIEQFLYFTGKAFGDTYKFMTYVDSPSFDTINSTGEDRFVRATIPLRTKGYLLPKFADRKSTTKKFFSVNKIRFGIEVDNVAERFNPQVSRPATAGITIPNAAPSTSIPNSAIVFLNTNITANADTITSTYADFNNIQILSSPGYGIPTPDKYSFTYFVNGQYIPPVLVTSITNITDTTVRVVFDTSLLGYILESTDIITVSGKFTGTNDSAL
jgi:hypothetical protein